MHRIQFRYTLGTGTRALFDEAGLRPEDIRGYTSGELSHAAVASAIVSGQADVGLGIAATANAFGLDFVPLVEERYHLACLKASLDQPPMHALLELLRRAEWHDALDALPGYGATQCAAKCCR